MTAALFGVTDSGTATTGTAVRRRRQPLMRHVNLEVQLAMGTHAHTSSPLPPPSPSPLPTPSEKCRLPQTIPAIALREKFIQPQPAVEDCAAAVSVLADAGVDAGADAGAGGYGETTSKAARKVENTDNENTVVDTCGNTSDKDKGKIIVNDHDHDKSGVCGKDTGNCEAVGNDEISDDGDKTTSSDEQMEADVKDSTAATTTTTTSVAATPTKSPPTSPSRRRHHRRKKTPESDERSRDCQLTYPELLKLWCYTG